MSVGLLAGGTGRSDQRDPGTGIGIPERRTGESLTVVISVVIFSTFGFCISVTLLRHSRTTGRNFVARKTIFVSDLTGKTIDEKDAATVTIKYGDARKGQVVLDVNANEVADLAAKGTKQARRGRKPKGATA